MIIIEDSVRIVKPFEEIERDYFDNEAEEVRAILAETDQIAEEIASGEAEDEMDVDSFHAWLDSLAPSDDELARRDLGDPGWGHLG